MTMLLVDAPTGAQELIEIGEGGGYFDPARILWDEREDGPLPAITLGGMVRDGAVLMYSQARMDEHIAATTPAPRPRHITVLALRNRFTKAEKVALEIAALDDPGASMAQRQQAAALRASMKDTEVANYIDLDRQDTREGITDLETATLIGAGRALEILDNPIQDEERPPTIL